MDEYGLKAARVFCSRLQPSQLGGMVTGAMGGSKLILEFPILNAIGGADDCPGGADYFGCTVREDTPHFGFGPGLPVGSELTGPRCLAGGLTVEQIAEGVGQVLGTERFGHVAIHTACQAASRSLSMAWAVKATMGMCALEPASRGRISAVAVRPSMIGISMSISTTSKAPAATASTASRPLARGSRCVPISSRAAGHLLVDSVVFRQEDAQRTLVA